MRRGANRALTTAGYVRWGDYQYWAAASYGDDDTRAPSKQYTAFRSWCRWISTNSNELHVYNPPNGSVTASIENNRIFGYTP